MININILDLVLDLIDMEVLNFLILDSGRNVIVFGVYMSSPSHNDNKKKDILIIGFGPTQGLEHPLPAEK